MIRGYDLCWKYQKEKKSPNVLDGVTFELQQGRITTFMGHSGAGKTTLLKCIANLHTEYQGIITYDGKDVRSLSPSERVSTIGFVLQQFHLFPHFTVLKNCTYALVSVVGMNEQEAKKRAQQVLESLGMSSYMNYYPPQLSGGQQQRLAIARALVLQPKVLLLDEPTSALDPESKKSLEVLLLDLNARGLTLVISSHDMPFIKRVMDQVYFMENGKLIEAWDRSSNEDAADGKINKFLSHN